ncbi:MmgE/PrpD family protein [Hoeflea sp. YIM 152468]|uniref:MmgE/PrpD family protein n=1 Tax=Hoeflea sp. YIM 152468 TaxID=3031759 RepID=UPI0023DC1CD3|nr:MmgE/PrpD family protein [Hoeflea sp. YIM 152468]MDF1608703.1 MmgE/PrpD family protein [Hoeflea sp. YIM 152468]
MTTNLSLKAGSASVSERIAEWIAKITVDDVPSATNSKARNILVDIVGLSVAARDTDYVTAVKAASEPGDHIIIGHKERVSASSAALINGTAAHGEDFDDTFEGGPVHSGVVVVPALLAAGQMYNLSNARVMMGIAVGTEVLCRLALTLPKAVHKAGFHPTAVLGAFAATAGICAACEADEKTTANALGIVGSMASGIIEYLGDGSWTKRMHPGWAAQSGLRAYGMAKAGFAGPRFVFEGTHGAFTAFAHSITPMTENLFSKLGEVWVMDMITFKPYPCGTMVQPYIDCAITLKGRSVRTDHIKRIVCKSAEGIVHRLWEPLDLKQKPPTAYAAKFSVPYGVALGLIRGHAALADFTDEAIKDPDLLAIAGKVGFEIDPDNPYPAAFTGHVRIEYEDGSIEEAERGHMRGGPTEPLSRQDIDDKFRANMRFGGHAAPDTVLALCDRIAAGEGNDALIKELGRT